MYFSSWRQTKIRQWLPLAAGLLALVALGILFADWAADRQGRWMREDLLYQTRMFTQTLQMDRLATLEGTAEDEAKPEYQRLKHQLLAASQINPSWTFVYLLDQTAEGEVVFLLDSEPPESPDASPPGQVYEEASSHLQRVFETGESAVEGPLPDRWGCWISAFVPLKDLKSGETVAVVGIDVDAGPWEQARSRAMILPIGCTFVLIFIWLLGSVLLARRARPGTCKTWLCWHLESLLLVMTGLTLTFTSARMAQEIETHNRQIAFRHLAQIEIAPPFDRIHALRDLALEGFASFVESREVVTEEEFQKYIGHLTELPEILFWNWVQAVREDDRKQFEARQNQYSQNGKYQIWEWSNQGEAIASPKRQRHFPLVYAAPEAYAQKLTGFDIGSSQAIRDVMETLIQTRLASASEPCTFFLSSGKDNGILLLRPIFNPEDPNQLLGMVTAGLDIKQWLRSGRDTDPDRLLMATLDLFQLSPTASPVYLGTSGEILPLHSGHFSNLPQEAVARPLLIFGKAYVLVAYPTPAFAELHPMNAATLIGLTGTALTFALAWILGLYVHRRERLTQLVDDQNRELATAMHRYDLLAQQNHIVTWEVDPDGLYLDISPTAATVLGYSPKELIEKKHFYDLYPAGRRLKFKEDVFEVMHQGKPIRDLLHPVLTHSGQTLWVSTSGIPTRDTEGNLIGYWGTDTDISDRKHAEESLTQLALDNQEAADRYAALIRASNTGAWEYNDTTGVFWCSPEYFSMLGYTQSELEPDSGPGNIEAFLLDLMHPDDRVRARAKLTTYLKIPEGMNEQNFRLKHKDGHWVWIWARGQVLRDAQGQPTNMMVGTHIDITATKQAEKALRASEQQYRMLTESMKDVVWTLDTQTRRFIYLSPSAEKLTGHTVAELMVHPLDAIMPENLRDELIHRLTDRAAQLRAGTLSPDSFFTSEIPFTHKNGSLIIMELVTHYWLNQQTGKVEMQAVARDITERKAAENELKENRRRYASLLANLPGMAYRCKNDRDWTMEFVSQGSVRVTGYPPEDLVNNKTLSFNDVICPAYRTYVWEKWQETLQKHGVFEAEYKITTRTGEIKWVWEKGEGVYDEGGNLLALEGFIADITARKNAEAERERLTLAIEQSGETIVITDGKGDILYVNPAFTQVSGYSREEAMGHNTRILKSGHQDLAFYQDMWKVLGAGYTWKGQLVNKRKDGTLFTEQASISPVRDGTGHIIYFVAVKRDITDQLRDQEEREGLQSQLIQSQKMESIGRLAGGVAHDFNNMLQAILGYTEMAIEQVPEGQPLYSDLQEIQKVAQRSAALTRQLQTFARKQITQPAQLQLNEALNGMSNMLSRLMGEEIKFIWKPGKHLGMVKVDPGQLDQIVVNLCVNARDAISKNGTITIETRNATVKEASGPLHDGIEPGEYILLSIRDDGSGMSPDVLSHLFEPFFTTKQLGKGTGLGLSTVYGIVKQSHGHIQVESKIGKGSTFTIYLPRFRGPEETAATEETSEPVASGTESILLVEDEPSILLTTCRMLESLGYQVYATSSPIEALQLAEQHKGNLHLLLTDVVMPGMNGPELVQQILPRDPKLKYLFMSGYTANLIEQHGVKANPATFIQKPFTRQALALKVRAVIDAL